MLSFQASFSSNLFIFFFSAPHSATFTTMSDEKTPDINVEMCKCYSFELMSEQELRESPVAFNPKIVCHFYMFLLHCI